jgi:glycogen synthase
MVSRILHLSNSPYASLAEAGPSYEIFRELAKDAADYHVLAQNVRRSFAYDREGNLHLHLLPARSATSFALFSFRAGRLVPRHGIEGIVCQDPVLGGAAGVYAARRHGIPSLVELHADVYFRYLQSRNPVLRAIGELCRRVLLGATRVRVSGPSLARALERVGVDPARMVQVPYRVKTDFFHPSDAARAEARARLGWRDEVLVTSVGRFIRQKGYTELLSAFARLRREYSAVRLVLAGGGPLEREYRAQIARLTLTDSVRLLGWVSREEQRDLLAAADVYTQPSVPGKGEWLPRAILEAMSMRLPVVASSVGGMADVVRDGENGLVFPAGDEDALHVTLRALARDPALRHRLGAAARRDAQELYDWDQGFARYREVVYTMDDVMPG